MLIGVRTAMGISQREFAEKLGVHESQVSRHMRNESYGIAVDRAARNLDALGGGTTKGGVKIAAPANSALRQPVTRGRTSLTEI
jgi:transcriptional regulator with XRE-family HTH domain